MPVQISQFSASVKALLRGFTSGQKVITALALVGLLVGGIAFTSWAGRPTMVPLFTSLEAADAAAVTENLTGKGIAYSLADSGRTVLVDQGEVYQLRIDLSAAGLPSAGATGYALLDKQGMTTSEFRQRVDFQRTLEGELSKTIGSIQDVRAATVHLVIPKETLFSDDTRKPSASVLLATKPGTTLTSGQVQAVVHLVSSSVEGLDATQVTVADDQGTVLNAPGEEGVNAAVGDARTAQTLAFEQKLSSSVQDMLTQLVGPGMAVVRIKADLDFDQRETMTETYQDPTAAPKTSESTTTETYTGTGSSTGGGVLGSGIAAGAVAGAAPGTPNNYAKKSGQTSYAVGKVTEQAKAAPGGVKRLSVAVMVDAKAGASLSTAELQKIVSAAVGLDPARGDVVQVTRMAFDTSPQKQAQAELTQAQAQAGMDQKMGWARTGTVVLGAILMALFVSRSLRRDRRTPVLLLPAELEAAPRAGEDRVLALAGAPRQLEESVESPGDKRANVREEIGDLVERQPDEVAQLLRGWLAEGRS